MKRLQDMANNVQAYTSTPTEYKLDVDTELQREVLLPYSAGKGMSLYREVVHVD